MGRNKALIPYGDGNLLSHLADSLSQSCDQVLISVRNREDYPKLKWDVIEDMEEGIGPIAGLEAGLCSAKHDWVFVLACDMPNWSAELLAEQWTRARLENSDAICLESEMGLEPLHSLFHRRSLVTVERAILQKKFNLDGLFAQLRVEKISWQEVQALAPQRNCFENWNTPQDIHQVV